MTTFADAPTHYHLTSGEPPDQRSTWGPWLAVGESSVLVACPWHADATPSCLLDVTYGRFWCMTCEREGTFDVVHATRGVP